MGRLRDFGRPTSPVSIFVLFMTIRDLKQDLSGDTYMYVYTYDVSRNKISTRVWSGQRIIIRIGAAFLTLGNPENPDTIPSRGIARRNPITRIYISMRREGEKDILPDLADAPSPQRTMDLEK